jgi:ubiquinone/menaquinone biosynthesis C-methylase UbiE
MRDWLLRRQSWAPELTYPLMERALAAIGEVSGPGTLLLDAGSGDGHMTDLFGAAGIRPVGIDVAYAIKGPPNGRAAHLSFAAGDVTRLPFGNASFDVVFVDSVLQYVDRNSALAELARVLRPGGLLVAVENLHGNPLARAARAYRRVTRVAMPRHLTPRAHPRYDDLGSYARHFSSAATSYYNILPPLLWAMLRVVPGAQRLRLFAGVYRLLHAADRLAVERLSFSRTLAWHAVVLARR